MVDPISWSRFMDDLSPRIRFAEPRDARGIRAIYAPIVEKTAISFETVVPTENEFEMRITKSQCEFPWLVCTRQDKILGYAYAGQFRPRFAYRWCAEVSVYVHQDWQRKGVALGLFAALFGILRMQGFVKAVGLIALPNHASVRLHERMGFQCAGVLHQVGFKLGQWHDVGTWELSLGSSPLPPTEPLKLGAILGTEKFERCLANGADCFESNPTSKNRFAD